MNFLSIYIRRFSKKKNLLDEKDIYPYPIERCLADIVQTYVGYLSRDIQGFPKKTPVPQKSKIFLIYSVMIRKAK